MKDRVNLADARGNGRLAEKVSHKGAKRDEVAVAIAFGDVPEDKRMHVAVQQVEPMWAQGLAVRLRETPGLQLGIEVRQPG